MFYGAHEIEDFKSRTRYAVLFLSGVLVFLFVVWVSRTILLLLFAAILCSLLLTTATDWVHAKIKIPRSAALVAVVLSGAILASLGVWSRGSAITEQFLKLQTDLPLAAHKLFSQIQATDWGGWLIVRLRGNAQQAGGFAFAISHIGGVVLTTATAAGALVILCMASLYFAVEPETYLKGLRLITPYRYREIVERCLIRVATLLRWWLLAKLVSMIAVGTLIFIGLWLLGVPLAGTLAIIAACLTFIPNIGPILSAVPAGLLAFAASPTKGLLTVVLFFLVHFIEGNFLTPLAEREIVKLPPGLTLAVQLFLGSITGVLGIALAAPITAALMGIAQALISIESQPVEPLRAVHASASKSCAFPRSSD